MILPLFNVDFKYLINLCCGVEWKSFMKLNGCGKFENLSKLKIFMDEIFIFNLLFFSFYKFVTYLVHSATAPAGLWLAEWLASISLCWTAYLYQEINCTWKINFVRTSRKQDKGKLGLIQQEHFGFVPMLWKRIDIFLYFYSYDLGISCVWFSFYIVVVTDVWTDHAIRKLSIKLFR